MNAHTPGPWIAREWECHAPTTVGVEIDGRFAPIATAKSVEGYYSKPEALANARLIAAAPDLLALAKQYASECGECDGKGTVTERDEGGWLLDTKPCPDCSDIRAVIAKAEA
jgi:hypothetical protein